MPTRKNIEVDNYVQQVIKTFMADGSTAKALQTKYTNPYTEELRLFENYVRTTLKGSDKNGGITVTK